MSDVLSIVNQALVRIGAEPIASFNDQDAQALAVSELYTTVSRRMLASHPWYFALKGALLGRVSLPTGEHKLFNKFEYLYQLPTDNVRVLGLESYDRFRLAGQRLYTNDKTPALVYVADVSPSGWAPYFEDLVVHELAAALAIAVTDTTSRADLYQAYTREHMRMARAINGQQTPVEIYELMQIYLRQSYNPLASA